VKTEKNLAAAGVSAAEEIDVVQLYERLRDELRNGSSHVVTSEGRREASRALAERFWPVSAERDVGSGPKGFVKRVLRKLLRWYVEPLASDQRVFNDAVLKLIDGLLELEDQTAHVARKVARLAGELEERLTRMERRPRSRGEAISVTVAPQQRAASFPDYFAFESRLRGSVSEIRERQRRYVDQFRRQAPVLDVGCGRGEFVGLLREAGVEVQGIDADADMVAYARGEGLPVEQADAVEFLGTLEDGSLGGIFCAQVVEHLPPPALVQLLELAAAKLRPDGLFVAETINPLSPLALRNYFADLTHAQPLVPETLKLLARQSGFAEAKISFLNAPTERLVEPDDPVIAANVRRLNDLLFAPLDYALFARTPGA